jgi:hypothetical protein
LTRQTTLAAVLLALLLAAATTFHDIESRSLWEDEGWTLLLAAGPSLSDIVQTMAYDQHPPLYFAAIHQWIDVVGDSEFALRSYSAFFQILSVAAIFQLGRVTVGLRAGIFAALLLAVWDFAIDTGQDARQYSQLLFLVMTSSAYYFRYLKHPTRGNGLGWLITSILLLYTQYTGGLVLIFQAMHWLIFARSRTHFSDMVIRFGAIGVAFLPWIPVFIRQNQVRWDFPIFYQSGLPNNSATFILMRDALLTKQFGLIIGLVLLGLVALHYVPTFRITWRPSGATVFLATWAILYVGLFIWLNESREILRLRIFVVVLPPILILVGRGLSNLQVMPQIFLMAVLLGLHLTTVDSRQNKVPWREVTQNVTDYHQPDEPVLMDIWVGDFPVRYYIQQQMDADWLSLRELRDSAGDFFLPQLADYVDDEHSFWLIRWNDDPEAYDGLLADLGFVRSASPYIDHEGNKLFSFRYDRLPQEEVALFDETIHLLDAEVSQTDDQLNVLLWWRTDEPLPLDYSVSVFVMDEAGTILAQQDGPPRDGFAPSSAWRPGEAVFDPHDLPLAADLPAGDYRVVVRLYWYAEPSNPLTVSGADDFATIQVIHIE